MYQIVMITSYSNSTMFSFKLLNVNRFCDCMNLLQPSFDPFFSYIRSYFMVVACGVLFFFWSYPVMIDCGKGDDPSLSVFASEMIMHPTSFCGSIN